MSAIRKFRITGFQVIALGFASLILLGALLLMLPFANRAPGHASFLDCLFTSVSAVCVTGLVVQDTATYWTSFGQAVILLMIQIGGMGVVTMAVMLSFVSGRKIGLLQRSVMQESISAPQVGGIVRLTKFFVFTALAIEGIGALLLMPVMIPTFGWARGIWYSVFHAISAFCNAGFDLMGVQAPYSSLTNFSQNILVNVVLVLLITIGGIGFLVWNDFKEHKLHWKMYRLQTKLVLITSAALVLMPVVWFMLTEMRDLPASQRILPSLFQSVTLRTAGFNTVDLTAMSNDSQALMMLWMLVGGSPGSTAGGMKTTTVTVLLLTAWSVFRRREQVTIMGRRIGDDVVRNAVAVIVMYLGLFFFSGIAISALEKLPLRVCLFETASALGTVGLTLGITSKLGMASRTILCLLMFMGRVGGLTLIYAAQPFRKTIHSTYPQEKVTVG